MRRKALRFSALLSWEFLLFTGVYEKTLILTHYLIGTLNIHY